MIPSSSAVSGHFLWSKTSNRAYELIKDGETIGVLQRQGGCLSTEFQAHSAAGNWRFVRSGWFPAYTEILDADSNRQLAKFKPGWKGGTVLFSDGETFKVTFGGFWQPFTNVLTETGQVVFSIRSRNKTVEMQNASNLPPGRMILLVMLAWHIARQAAEDSASAAVIVAATS